MGEKSRKEKRKESRTVKKQTKFSSWIKHLKSSKTERIGSNPCVTVAFKPANLEDLNAKLNGFSKERICNEEHSSENPKGAPVSSNQSDESSEVFLGNFACPGMTTHESHGDKPVAGKKTTKKILNRTRKKVVSDLMDPKANFQYLEMETNKGFFTEFDLEMEKKLAKKLKVKGGKLSGLDGLDDLIEDIPYAMDSEINQSFDVGTAKSSGCVKSRKKNTRRKLMDASELSGKVASDMKLIEGSKEQENEKMIQRSSDLAEHKGTQNDFVEVKPNDVHALSQNLELEDPCSKEPALDNVGKYVPPQLRSRAESDENYMFRRRVKRLLNKLNESSIESTTGEMSSIFQLVGRSIACQTIGEELLAYAGGPRSSEHFAAVYAAFVAGMACLVGIDFSAKIIASLAKAFEAEYSKGDSLSVETLARLFSYMCNFGVCSSDLIYDFLSVLSKRLMELDVSAIKIMLECCGMKLRGDDPAAMKDFILGVQQRANELQTVPVSTPNGYPGITNKRMEILLQMICDIKNNKKRTKEDSVPHTRVKKWLQKLGVENVLLRGLKWSKLLDPHKKGQWWLSGDTITSAKDNAAEIAGKIDREVLDAQKLLRLAAAQRMNTDSRKAIFCIIMSSEDYIDAFEKILRLDLPGKQDREIMRVLVECCLQEKVFNKYYSVLASKLCSHDKNHKFTLQYCLWDHFKQLESMELSRSMNLARFIAEMLTSFSLSLAVLKSVDLGNPKLLTAKWVMHFRMLFEAILEHPDALVWNIFTRIAVAPELEWLRSGIEFFVKQYVTGTSRVPAEKFKVLKKALNNVAGILM